MPTPANKKVLLGMSGGLDSSAAALLLQQQGWEVVGATLQLPAFRQGAKFTNDAYIRQAQGLAAQLGMEHHIVDAQQVFQDEIIAGFVREYLNGRTPNPCVTCNRKIKWGMLEPLANKLGCGYIATGHYAQTRYRGDVPLVATADDRAKDQSYFLWQLTRAQLARTLFPLGGRTKAEIRQMAAQAGWETIAGQKESLDVCFIPDNDYRKFLRSAVEGLATRLQGGKFVYPDGTEIGRHHGYPFYTIGQRKGLEVAVGHPLYVQKIDAATNTITLGRKEALLAGEMDVHSYNLPAFDTVPESFEAEVKIRYRNQATPAQVTRTGHGLHVQFSRPVSAITPGQSAVFMEGGLVLGGGIIA